MHSTGPQNPAHLSSEKARDQLEVRAWTLLLRLLHKDGWGHHKSLTDSLTTDSRLSLRLFLTVGSLQTFRLLLDRTFSEFSSLLSGIQGSFRPLDDFLPLDSRTSRSALSRRSISYRVYRMLNQRKSNTRLTYQTVSQLCVQKR